VVQSIGVEGKRFHRNTKSYLLIYKKLEIRKGPQIAH
jgi:hypothetical protein